MEWYVGHYSSSCSSANVAAKCDIFISKYCTVPEVRHVGKCLRWASDMLKSVPTDWKSTSPACTAFAEKARWNSQMTTVWIKEKQQTLKLAGPWLRKSSVHCDLFQLLKTCGIEPLETAYKRRKHQELNERTYYLEITTSSTVSVQIFMTCGPFSCKTGLSCEWTEEMGGKTWYPSASEDSTYDIQKTWAGQTHIYNMRTLHNVSHGYITCKHTERHANNTYFRSNTCIYSKKVQMCKLKLFSFN